jgi:hypothetical protein
MKVKKKNKIATKEKNEKKKLPTIRRIPDDIWLEIKPLLGVEKKPGSRGRPPVPFRKERCLTAFYTS